MESVSSLFGNACDRGEEHVMQLKIIHQIIIILSIHSVKQFNWTYWQQQQATKKRRIST